MAPAKSHNHHERMSEIPAANEQAEAQRSDQGTDWQLLEGLDCQQWREIIGQRSNDQVGLV